MPEQKRSIMLTQEENEIIFSLLGYKCQTLATTVVELYTTGSPSGCEWIHKETGVLCLVKDSVRRSYFFRLFCPFRRKTLWEHELYENIDYLAPTVFLHTFEAENCIAAFNFASEEEGEKLRNALLTTIESKKQRRVERRNRHNNINSRTIPKSNGVNFSLPSNKFVHQPLIKGKKDGKKRIFSKADIGHPTGFQHVSHIGWDPLKGFDFEKADDPQLKEFFNQAGVSENHLKDKETREFIYDFIARNGGIEAVKEEIIKPPPPIPQRIRAVPPQPRPPVRIPPGPPPPPPQRLQPPRSLPNLEGHEEQTLPVAVDNYFTVPNSKTVNPPPPPPPPPPGLPPAPGLPPPSMAGPEPPRSLLMQEIVNRKQLKPLNLEDETDDKKNTPVVSDQHFQLMDQIKVGIKLRPVSTSPTQNLPTPTSSGLADALARALQERSKVIHSDSSPDSSDTDDQDGWEE